VQQIPHQPLRERPLGLSNCSSLLACLVRPPSACGYCQGALEQRGGRGRPRTYHHSRSGLAKREQDRARGKPRPRPRVPDTD